MSLELSEKQRKKLHLDYRYSRILLALGIDHKSRMIVMTLLLDSNGWSIQTLSDTLGYSRATIRDRLNDMRLSGTTHYDEDTGWHLTDSGRRTTEWLRVEAMEIANGVKRKFSKELMDHLEMLNNTGVERKVRIRRDIIL